MSAFVRRMPAYFAMLLALLVTGPRPANTQETPGSDSILNLPGELGGLPSFGAGGNEASFSASYQLKPESREGILSVEVAIDAAWHIYSITQPEGGPLPTVIKVESPGVELLGQFQANPAPEVHYNKEFWGDLPNEEHRGSVTWTAPIRIPERVSPESFPIKVVVEAQACTNDLGRCINVGGDLEAAFQGYNEQLALATAAPPAARTTGQSQSRSATDSAEAVESDLESTAEAPAVAASIGPMTLALYIGLGLIGGLVLNLMPCVLPVIGLKVLALAEQAHMHRGEVLKLNLWFTAGIISVFMVLATLASAFTLSWGEQFTDTTFKITITAVVFAMALSFLGVWEIPIPGFVGRGVSNDLQQKEGPLGAFFKGVFTTILSTPCSGPALGAVFAIIVGRPAYIAYILFFSIGLGMALPYLLIGLFPALLRFLPKPGQWMDTFKHVMGFVLLLTVAYLFTTLNSRYFVPTWTLLIGVWFGCWLIGRIPATAEGGARLRGWVTAAAVIAAAALVVNSKTFHDLVHPPLIVYSKTSHDQVQPPTSNGVIQWQPYSPEALDEALASGKTVMLDFTAQWCLTCKWNLKRAIQTEEVAKVLDQNDVVPLLADWTDRNDEIKAALGKLKANSIPLLAIYPAGQKENVIVLRDVISKSQLVEALNKAGPSRGEGSSNETAMITPAKSTGTSN